MQYLYQNKNGLLSNINPLSLFDTREKITTIFYSFLSFGFIPLFAPLALLPIIGHFATYFVLASDLTAAQGTFGQYRVMLAPLLTWSTILVISKYKRFNTYFIAIFLLCATLLVQYLLHLPLSYLSKQWFWQQPTAVTTINGMIRNYLPSTASVVAQNNIVPHISHRDKIYSLYPETKTFLRNSPCGTATCDWFRWFGHPEYLLVDTSSDWDARDFLTDRITFIQGLRNLEKEKVITIYINIGTTTLYTVNKNPEDVR